jgi:aquaporin Z
MSSKLGAALLAEFVGTFALVLVGMQVVHHALSAGSGGAGLLVAALGHGLILSVMVSVAIPTSGGHFNPAVTLSFLVSGRMKPVAGVSYIVIQLLAGTIAALIVSIIQPPGANAGAAVTHGVPDFGTLSPGIALLIEFIATIFLVTAVWGTCADPRARNVGGFAIGLTVAADILAFGPLTGASMNPARSFGPTLLASMVPGGTSFWPHHWVYWVGPLLGGAIVGIVYSTIMWPKDNK